MPSHNEISPTQHDLDMVFRSKYCNVEKIGWGPKMRSQFNYFTPDDYYETVVNKLVHSTTDWLDVGSGRFLFPSNHSLAQELSGRCHLLVGLDPDQTLLENPYVHEKVRQLINDYRPDRKFNLITMNMVAEHVVDADSAVENLSKITLQGGYVVVYTIFKWSPIPIITYLTPFNVHHPIKKLLWNTESKDTFPVAYKMNTRSHLKDLFEQHNFQEQYFSYLDDCRTFAKYRTGQLGELFCMKLLRGIGMHYPEVCLLGVYKRL